MQHNLEINKKSMKIGTYSLKKLIHFHFCNQLGIEYMYAKLYLCICFWCFFLNICKRTI